MANKSKEYLDYKRYIRSKEWKVLRDEIVEERGGKCQICGRADGEDKTTLVVHHNSYNNLYNERNHKEDLLVCCTICHRCLHLNKNNFKRFKLPTNDANTNS